MKDINVLIQETLNISNKINLKKSMLQHIVAKLLTSKDKEKNFKAVREKHHIIYMKTREKLP